MVFDGFHEGVLHQLQGFPAALPADLVVVREGVAASCTKAGQQVPEGCYNAETMLKGVSLRDAEVAVCGTCMDARGLREEEHAQGCRRPTFEELADWALWSDRALVF